jgi:DNA-binding NarL/FixJ family response regulator
MPVRVALVDDHQAFRERLRALLIRDPEIEIVAEAGSGHELLEVAMTTEMHVVCMDIRLPGMSGIETTRRLLAIRPAIRVIGLSAYAEPHYVETMLDAGAVGHFTKADAGEDLLRAIHEATAARPQFGANIAVPGAGVPPGSIETVEPATGHQQADTEPPGPREAEVRRLIAEGLDSAQIARALSIDPGLVEVYRRNIARKLHSRNSR